MRVSAHADTRFEPILRAYNAITNGTTPDSFVVLPARVGDCLDLLPEVRLPNEPKYSYVYGSRPRHGGVDW